MIRAYTVCHCIWILSCSTALWIQIVPFHGSYVNYFRSSFFIFIFTPKEQINYVLRCLSFHMHLLNASVHRKLKPFLVWTETDTIEGAPVLRSFMIERWPWRILTILERPVWVSMLYSTLTILTPELLSDRNHPTHFTKINT